MIQARLCRERLPFTRAQPKRARLSRQPPARSVRGRQVQPRLEVGPLLLQDDPEPAQQRPQALRASRIRPLRTDPPSPRPHPSCTAAHPKRRHPLAIRVDLHGRKMIILRLRPHNLNKDRPTRDPRHNFRTNCRHRRHERLLVGEFGQESVRSQDHRMANGDAGPRRPRPIGCETVDSASRGQPQEFHPVLSEKVCSIWPSSFV
jgi:hypothetical protein